MTRSMHRPEPRCSARAIMEASMRMSLVAVSVIVLGLINPGNAPNSESAACDTRDDCSSATRKTGERPSERAVITRAATRHGCAGVDVNVIAASDKEHDLACSAARDAFEFLARCGIRPRAPVSIRVVEKAFHPVKGEVFGFFDGQSATVSTPSGASAFAAGTPYGLLPDDVFYRSLIVHEVAHAVMAQNYSHRPQSRAALEYPAYVVQFATLPADAREKLLNPPKTNANAPPLLFNDIILAMDPFVFAVSAYEHFAAAANGCQHLNALLKGEVDFILTIPPGL